MTAADSSAHREGALLPAWLPMLRRARLTDPRLSDAACSGKAPMFDTDPLPGETPTDTTNRHAAAIQICHQCPVLASCRTVAAELGDDGTATLWAATTPPVHPPRQ